MQRVAAVGGAVAFTMLVAVACVDEPSAARQAADVSAKRSTRCPRSETNRPECTRQARTAGRVQGIQSLSYQPSQFDAGMARNVVGGIVELTSDDAYRGRTAPLVAQTLAPFSNRYAPGDGRFTDDSVSIRYEPFAEPIADAGVYSTLGWEYWDDYPHSPQGVPMSATDNRVLWLSPDLTANPAPLAITIRSSRLLTILGIEVSGFATDRHDGYGYQDGGSFTLQYYRDSATVVASASASVGKLAGAQSLAASGLVHTRTASADQWNDVTFVGTEIPGGFNRVVVTGSSYLAALVNVRYRLAAKLTVKCNPASVERGTDVRCVMSAGGPISSPEWSFRNDSVVGDPPIDGGDTVWTGPVAIGGTVIGKADVGGQSMTDTAKIAVTDRPWRANGKRIATTLPTVLLQSPALPPYPRVQHDLGRAVMQVDVDRPVSNPLVRHISAGPNTGFDYFSDMPLVYREWKVDINEAALRSTSAWRLSFPSGITMTGTCTRSQLDRLRALLEAHEGTEPDRHSNSHTRIFRDFVDSAGVTLIERAVYGVNPSPSTILGQINNGAVAHSRLQTDSTSRNPLNSLNCNLNLLPNP